MADRAIVGAAGASIVYGDDLQIAASGATVLYGQTNPEIGAAGASIVYGDDLQIAAIGATILYSEAAVGPLSAILAPVTASFTGSSKIEGSISCILAPVTASLTGEVISEGTLSATLAPVIAAFLGAGVPAEGILTAVLTPVAASISGTAENQGILSATLGQVVASIQGASGQAPVMGPFRYPGVDPDHPDGRRHRRQIAKVVNNLNQGKISSTGKFTLTVNADTTTLVDARLGPWSLIFFDPLTGSAATELYGGTMYVTVTDRLQGQCIITHANSADAAREFRYFIVG